MLMAPSLLNQACHWPWLPMLAGDPAAAVEAVCVACPDGWCDSAVWPQGCQWSEPGAAGIMPAGTAGILALSPVQSR